MLDAIERLHEEFKRRIKTQTVLPSAETAAMLFWALLATCAVGIVASPVVVWLIASGLERFDDAVLMTRVMFPYIGFMSLVALSAGILNTWKRFAVPAATPVLLNLAVIGAAWGLVPLFRRHGIEPIHALAVGAQQRGGLGRSRDIGGGDLGVDARDPHHGELLAHRGHVQHAQKIG